MASRAYLLAFCPNAPDCLFPEGLLSPSLCLLSKRTDLSVIPAGSPWDTEVRNSGENSHDS